jgi:hypothetical protein
MLWTNRTMKRNKGAPVVRLDHPLHGANINDAPACEHGQAMATIKRHPDRGLVLRYWRCHCEKPLVGTELYRCIREMRRALSRQQKREHQQPMRSWHGDDAA